VPHHILAPCCSEPSTTHLENGAHQEISLNPPFISCARIWRRISRSTISAVPELFALHFS
jgi:hypothetical protein